MESVETGQRNYAIEDIAVGDFQHLSDWAVIIELLWFVEINIVRLGSGL